ncbi:MAG: DUF4258 domain-containing protein [Bacteroidetes bacterium]|nr:DUF4258 domain-containing protein [Bacteroidota bacterium]MBU2637187.1 DUF4258 domain-containing protein [Bacteroidota bacterium]
MIDFQKDKIEMYFSKISIKMIEIEWITRCAVEEALTKDRILEHYEDKNRGESCLVVGFTEKGIPIHVVCKRLK